MVNYVWQAIDVNGKLMSIIRGPLTSKKQALEYAGVTYEDETEYCSDVYRNCNMTKDKPQILWKLQIIVY